MTRDQHLSLALDRIKQRTQRLADERDGDGTPLTYVRRAEMMIEQAGDVALVRSLALPLPTRLEARS